MSKRVRPEDTAPGAPPLMITDLIRDMIVDEIAPRLDPAGLRYFASTCKKLHEYFEGFALPSAKDILSEGHLRFAEVVLVSRACSLPNSSYSYNWGARVWWYVRNPFHDSIQSVFKYNSLRPHRYDMCQDELGFYVLRSLVEAKRDDLVRDFINSGQLVKYDSNMMDTLFFAILGRSDYIDVFRRFAVLPQVTAMITDAYDVQRLMQCANEESVSRLLNLVEANEHFASSFREAVSDNAPMGFWPRLFYLKACKLVGIAPLPMPSNYDSKSSPFNVAIATRNIKRVRDFLPLLEEELVDRSRIIKGLATMISSPDPSTDTAFVEIWKVLDEKGWIDERLIVRKDVVNMQLHCSLTDLHFLHEWAEVRHLKMARLLCAFFEF